MIVVDEEDEDLLHAHHWMVRPDGYVVARYFAQVRYGGHTYYLGSYDTPEEAARKVDLFYSQREED
jgi:hypothetical protein